ncbi:MAG: signal peptidase I [Sandaracinaceae bacterium]
MSSPSESKTSSKKPVVSPDDERWERHKANFKTIGGAVLLALFIRIVLFEAFEIDGPSMEPSLLHGDRVVVSKFVYGLFLPFTHEAVLTWGLPDHGDVVIVHSPADNIDIVKRVIGLPGDTVEVRDDVVYVNDEAIMSRSGLTCMRDGMTEPNCEWTEERLGEHDWHTSHSPLTPPSSEPLVTVPDGHIFVMGDHRDRSNDSRDIGMIPSNRIKGRAMAIYWSNDGEVRWNRMFRAID